MMSEHADDELKLRFGDGQEFLMTRCNAKLYTFIGNLATRDHIFLKTGEQTEESSMGSFIFAHSDSYYPLIDFMVEHDFPMSLNNNTVPALDEQAFGRSLEQLTGSVEEDYIPDDFYE